MLAHYFNGFGGASVSMLMLTDRLHGATGGRGGGGGARAPGYVISRLRINSSCEQANSLIDCIKTLL